MPLTFEVTTTEHEIVAQPGSETEVVFTVTNKKAEPVDGRASFSVDEEANGAASWLSFEVDDEDDDEATGNEASEPRTTLERRFRAKGTDQMTVAVKVPADAALGEYEFRLAVADADRPAADWTESKDVRVTLTGDEDVEHGSKFPWWIVALIAGGAVVIGGAILLIVLLTGNGDSDGDDEVRPTLAEACTDSCADNLECTPISETEKQCLRAEREQCAASEECAGVCVEGRCASVGGIQQPCKDGHCSDGLVCHEDACLLPDGASCARGDECVGQFCLQNPGGDETSKICMAVPAPGAACLPGGLCAGGLACTAGRCVGPVGYSSCKSNEVCETGFCKAGVCSPRPGLGESCRGNVCPAPFQCVNKRCTAKLGVAGCAANSHCTTGFCKNGTCAESGPGRCSSDRDCATGQKCGVADGRRVCQWQTGRPCVLNGECLGGLCSSGKCFKYTGRCTSTDQCRSNQTCTKANQCKLRAGEPCRANRQCVSLNCTKNRCSAAFRKCPTCPRFHTCVAGSCTLIRIKPPRPVIMRPIKRPVIRFGQ